jgi:hypothetical protein
MAIDAAASRAEALGEQDVRTVFDQGDLALDAALKSSPQHRLDARERPAGLP